MELDINTIKNEIKKINELYEPQGFKIVSIFVVLQEMKRIFLVI